VLGGLLAWSRPWRWALGSGVLAGMLPQVLAAVLHKPAAETPRREARWGAVDILVRRRSATRRQRQRRPARRRTHGASPP